MEAQKLAITLLVLIIIGLVAWSIEAFVDRRERKGGPVRHTAERTMRRTMTLIVVGIVICAALSLFGFLHLFGII